METVAIVRNTGRTRSFPTCVGNIRIPKLSLIKIHNIEAAREIGRFPNVSIEYIEDPETRPDRLRGRRRSQVDYSIYKIWELRSIAASLGIKGFFTMRKKDLIEQISKE